MKSIRILIILLCIGALAPATSLAAKEKKANKPGKIVRQYDTNGNGTIDGDEVGAVRKAFEADKTGPLKQFDTDSDGTLSDSEIAAMKGGKKKNK
jgi:Ca2+-binding EF-hand superfamily protein